MGTRSPRVKRILLLFVPLFAGIILMIPSMANALVAMTNVIRASAGVSLQQGSLGNANYVSQSADGRYVVFNSEAANVIAGDTNNQQDVFMRDTQTGVITRISTDSSGGQAEGGISYGPAVSADGRYVVFASLATNLVANDTNATYDVFLKDTQTGSTTRVSTDSAGLQSDNSSFYPSISADNRYVAFYSIASNLAAGDTNGFRDVFIKDLQTGSTTRVSTDSLGAQANGQNYFPEISADGRYVTFESNATNLVAGDTNGTYDFFRKDLQTGAIVRVSTDSIGAQSTGGNAAAESFGPEISADGRYIVFTSSATNLVAGDTNAVKDSFVKDVQTGTTYIVSADSAGNEGVQQSYYGSISDDGRYVAFVSGSNNLVAGDTNNQNDIFIKDIQTGTTTRVSTNSSGGQANFSSSHLNISADGLHVAFESSASDLVANDNNGLWDIFSKNLQTDSTILISGSDIPGVGGSGYYSALSGDGKRIIFYSYDANQVSQVTNTSSHGDAFLYDANTGIVTLISTDASGNDSNGYTEDWLSISSDGKYAVFWSTSTNLTADCNDGNYHSFVKNLDTGGVVCASTNTSGVQGNNSNYPGGMGISDDGRYVVMSSFSSNLVTGDTGYYDVFVKDLQTGVMSLVSSDSAGTKGNEDSDFPSISGDGRYVTFVSEASNLVPGDTNALPDIFVKDLQTGVTTRVSTDSAGLQANDRSAWVTPYISDDGQIIVYSSLASNLVAGDTNGLVDLFMKDIQTGVTTRLNTNAAGQQATGGTTGEYGTGRSDMPFISDDGRYLAFSSGATNLVLDDTNNVADVFIKDLVTGDVSRVSTDDQGNQGNNWSQVSATSPQSLSGDGRYISFVSNASNLVEGDGNGETDIFLRANPFITTPSPDNFASAPLQSTSGGNTASVLPNDLRNGAPVDPSAFILSIADDGGLDGLIINPDGTLTIPAGASGGNYTITYQMCEVAAPTYCQTSSATVAVLGAATSTESPTSNTSSTGQLAQTGIGVLGSLAIGTLLVTLASSTIKKRYIYKHGVKL